MVKRSYPKQQPPMSAEGQPGPNQNATSEDRRRIAAKAKRHAPRGRPSKPGPISTDISPLFKDKDKY